MENRKRVCNFNKNMKSKRRRLADKFYKEVYQDSSDSKYIAKQLASKLFRVNYMQVKSVF